MRLFTGTCSERNAEDQARIDEIMDSIGFLCALRYGKGKDRQAANAGIGGLLKEAGDEERTYEEIMKQDAPIAVVMNCTLGHLEAGRLYGVTESQFNEWTDIGLARAATPAELEAWRAAGGYEAYKPKPETYTPPTYRELARYRRSLGLSGIPRDRARGLRHLAMDRTEARA